MCLSNDYDNNLYCFITANRDFNYRILDIYDLDLFDILFPWMAYSDDLFLATLLLKLLHKYGGLPDEDKTTPKDLLKNILNKE